VASEAMDVDDNQTIAPQQDPAGNLFDNDEEEYVEY
jgi:hypothetical protein